MLQPGSHAPPQSTLSPFQRTPLCVATELIPWRGEIGSEVFVGLIQRFGKRPGSRRVKTAPLRKEPSVETDSTPIRRRILIFKVSSPIRFLLASE